MKGIIALGEKTILYLTRHGETQWNVEKRLQGWQDSPLTERGIQQAMWLRDALASVNFEAIYASSSVRTKKTAEIVRDQRTCDLIALDDLREIYLGTWEGLKGQELQEKFPTAYHAFWETPHLYHPENGGESFDDLQRRIVPLIDALIAKHRGETICLVTHSAALNLIMTYFTGSPLAELWHPPILYPTSLCKVVIEDEGPRVELHGDISHYREVIG